MLWLATRRGYNSCNYWTGEGSLTVEQPYNQLRTFCDNRDDVQKWSHYFEIYERHFSRFQGQEVHIAEIGICYGGSLKMWRDYFGPKAHMYGVDIQPQCKAYERDGVKVFIGDQADRSFWREFRTQVPQLDIVIDDGGHQYQQQVVSLEELLPHLRPGGVYLCEDVHGAFNRFGSYVGGLAHKLNEMENPPAGLIYDTTIFQKRTNSIHLYPFVVVVEKNRADVPKLVSAQKP
jgi:SAM-dependent methyltransferase